MMMNRSRTCGVAAFASGLLFAGHAAFAGVIDPNTTQFDTGGLFVISPLDGLREVTGPNSSQLTIASPPGVFAPLDQLDVDFVVLVHDDNGVNMAIAIFEDINGGADTSMANGATVIDVDPSAAPLGSNLRTAINTANLFVGVINVTGGGLVTGTGIGLVVNDQSGNGAQTLLDLDNEGADMIFEPDIDGPRLLRVVRDKRSEPERLVMAFDDVISPSLFESLENTDFDFSSTQMGQFAAFSALAFPGNPSLAPSADNRTLVFEISPFEENLAPEVGNFVRIALPDNGGTTNDSLFDLAMNPADEQEAVIVESANVADLNDDNAVTGVDLSMLLAAWGRCGDPKSCPADLNGDGVVDAMDLSQLIASWSN